MGTGSDTPMIWLISGLCVCAHACICVLCMLVVKVYAIYTHMQRPEEDVLCLSL